MTIPSPTQPALVRRILRSPPLRVLLLGFLLLVMMGLNFDVMTSYAAQPVKAVQHIMALAVAGFALYIGFAYFVEQRSTSELGLAAYVQSGNLQRALRVAEALDVGMVGVNRGLVSDPAAPFGGVKESGLGREGGSTGIDEFLETKYIGVKV